MFSSVLDKLDTWIGRNFLLAAFFPFLLFGVANVFMAQVLLPGKVAEILAFLSGGYFGPVNATFVLLALCAVLAYITNPFVRLLTEALKGSYLIRPVRNVLIAEQSRRYYGLVRRRIQLGLVSGKLSDSSVQGLKSRLDEARNRGLICKCVMDKKTIAIATRAVLALVAKRNQGDFVEYSDLSSTTDAMCVALSVNCASASDIIDVRGSVKPSLLRRVLRVILSKQQDKEPLYLNEARVEAVKLDNAWRMLIDTISTAKQSADVYYTKAVNAEQRQFSSSEIHPTAFGNNYAALERYFDERFNIDLNFMLPILSIITSSDKVAGDALANAQQQLDFAMRTFLFVIVFTMIWLAVGASVAESIYVIPILATAGFAATILTLEVVQASFRGFGETVRAICILKRFEVLKALHVSLPETWDQEKVLWENVNSQLQWAAADATIKYTHGNK